MCCASSNRLYFFLIRVCFGGVCGFIVMAPKAVEAEQKGGKSRAEKKPVKTKAEKKPVKEGGKKKKAKSTETYKIYIYKVLKQVRVFFPPSFVSVLWGIEASVCE